MRKTTLKLVLVLMSSISAIYIQAQKEVNKTFAAKEKLKISTVSGNCTIEKAADNNISVKLTYTYSDDCFNYKFDESGNTLSISEKFDGNCRGESEWKILVPESTAISFNTASGDFGISDTKNGLDGNTASGNLKIKNVSGEIELNTASGDIVLTGANGEVHINTASGNIKIASEIAGGSIISASGDIQIQKTSEKLKAKTASGNIDIEEVVGGFECTTASGDIKIEKLKGNIVAKTASGNIEVESADLSATGRITTASGNIEVELSKSLENDLEMHTASGNITLDYNGNPVNGYFEFTARKDKGSIVSPFEFDKEEVIDIDGKDYDKKSFTKGSSEPKVILKTSSGTVRLNK